MSSTRTTRGSDATVGAEVGSDDYSGDGVRIGKTDADEFRVEVAPHVEHYDITGGSATVEELNYCPIAGLMDDEEVGGDACASVALLTDEGTGFFEYTPGFDGVGKCSGVTGRVGIDAEDEYGNSMGGLIGNSSGVGDGSHGEQDMREASNKADYVKQSGGCDISNCAKCDVELGIGEEIGTSDYATNIACEGGDSNYDVKGCIGEHIGTGIGACIGGDNVLTRGRSPTQRPHDARVKRGRKREQHKWRATRRMRSRSSGELGGRVMHDALLSSLAAEMQSLPQTLLISRFVKRLRP